MALFPWLNWIYLLLLLVTIFMIIHIKYVKPALTRGLTDHDCGGPWAGSHFALA